MQKPVQRPDTVAEPPKRPKAGVTGAASQQPKAGARRGAGAGAQKAWALPSHLPGTLPKVHHYKRSRKDGKIEAAGAAIPDLASVYAPASVPRVCRDRARICMCP